MPRYSYKCLECEKTFNVSHSMKEEYTYCDICEKDSLVKVFSPIRKRKQAKDKKVGDVVKKYIEDTKEDLKDEKEKLKQEGFE